MPKNHKLEQIIQVITSNDYNHYDHNYRAAQVRALETAGPDAIPFLVELLENDGTYGSHTIEALEVLEAFGATEAIPSALELAEQRDHYGCSSAVKFLGALGVEASIPALEELLFDDRDTFLQKSAATALGSFPQAAPLLLRYLEQHPQTQHKESGESMVPIAVVTSLGRLQAQEALPTLHALLHEEECHEELRCAALEALAQIGPIAQYIAPLRTLLEAPDCPYKLRAQAAQTLCAHAAQETLAVLLRIAAGEVAAASESLEERLRNRCAQLLQCHPAGWLQSTLRAAQASTKVAPEDRQWLAEAFSPQGAERWLALLHDSPYQVKTLCVRLLPVFGTHPAVCSALQSALTSSWDHEKRAQAAAALDLLEASPIPLDFATMYESEDPVHRSAALEGLALLFAPGEKQEGFDQRVRTGLASWTKEEALALAQRACKDPSAKVRSEALCMLTHAMPSPDTNACLREGLQDESSLVRSNLAWALGERTQPDTEGASLLLALLEDPQRDVRHSVVSALQKRAEGGLLDAFATSTICQALLERWPHEDDRRVRFLIADALGALGDPTATNALCDNLKHPDSTVRERCISALAQLALPGLEFHVYKPQKLYQRPLAEQARTRLGESACQRLAEELRSLLSNPDEPYTIRRHSCRLLGALLLEETLPLLETLCHEDDDHDVRKLALISLAENNSTVARQALLRLLASREYQPREAAARMFEELGDDAPKMEILASFEEAATQGDINTHAVNALAKLGVTEAIPALLGALHRGWEDDTITIASALGQLHATEAVDALLELLSEFDGYNRARIIRALGQIPAPEVIAPLEKAIEDPNEDVRREALHALARRNPTSRQPAFVEALRHFLAQHPEDGFACQQYEESTQACLAIATAWHTHLYPTQHPTTTEQNPHTAGTTSPTQKPTSQSDVEPWLKALTSEVIALLEDAQSAIEQLDVSSWQESHLTSLQTTHTQTLHAWHQLRTEQQADTLTQAQTDLERALFDD